MSEPCKRAADAGAVVGDPCPDCGHTNIVHPFHTNTLTECVVCRLLAEVERVKGITDGKAVADAVHRELLAKKQRGNPHLGLS